MSQGSEQPNTLELDRTILCVRPAQPQTGKEIGTFQGQQAGKGCHHAPPQGPRARGLNLSSSHVLPESELCQEGHERSNGQKPHAVDDGEHETDGDGRGKH